MTETSIKNELEIELENYKTAFEFSQKRQREYIEKWRKLHSYLNSFLELDCNNGCIEDDDKLIEAMKEKLQPVNSNKFKFANEFKEGEFAIYKFTKLKRADESLWCDSKYKWIDKNNTFHYSPNEFLEVAKDQNY